MRERERLSLTRDAASAARYIRPGPMIALDDYPQLAMIAWNRKVRTITEGRLSHAA